jgi:hypothetical protein
LFLSQPRGGEVPKATALFLFLQDEIIVFRQLSKIEVKQISDIMLKEVFRRAEEKGIKIEVTERFKVVAVPLTQCAAIAPPLCIFFGIASFVLVLSSVCVNSMRRVSQILDT